MLENLHSRRLRPWAPMLVCWLLTACAPTGSDDRHEDVEHKATGATEGTNVESEPWWSALPRAGWSGFTRLELPEDQDWFEVYEVGEGTYGLLEPGQWQEVISWLIVGTERALLFDTGLGIGDVAALAEALTDRPLIVLNSHTHPDHIGGNHRFDTIWGTDHADAVARRDGLGHAETAEFLFADGAVWKPLPAGFERDQVRIEPFSVDRAVEDGERIDLGGRALEVMFTPGHAADALTLFDAERGMLFTGDTFYPAPLYAHLEGSNFEDYRKSAARLAGLADHVTLVAGGHNEPVRGGSVLVDMAAAFDAVAAGRLPDSVRDGVERHEFGRFQILSRTRPGKFDADTLYVGKHIITMDADFPGANAVAVDGETIRWVGTLDEWQGSARQTVDLGDRALLPGFIDAHGHLSFMARTVNLANAASPPVGPVTDIRSLQDVLRKHMAERDIAPGGWVLGMGYDDSLLREQRHPDRDDLDTVSTRHPVALIHVSGHLMAANSLALERAGIDALTPDPPGGIIRRRGSGREPDGVLEETATAALQRFFLGGDDIPAEDVDRALLRYAQHGITTVQDGAASWDVYRTLAASAAGAGLKLDVVVYPQGMAVDFAVPDGIALGEYRNRLKFGGVKLILDGSPQGKTAYLSQPYHQVPAGLAPDYRGYPTLLQRDVDGLVARYLGQGMPMLVHCNGDAAAQMLIGALARAAADTPMGDHRTVMIHAQTVTDDQLDAMKTQGILPSYFSAHTFYWGDWHRDSVLGPQRAARISPTASTVARGMRFTIHNDAPVVPPHMLRLLWATTNRLTRSGAVLGEEQRVSTLDALRAVTIDAAYQYFEEDRKGSLTPGKQADLVVLSGNPLLTPPAELQSLRVVETVSRGVTVYAAPASPSQAPPG